MEIEDLDWGTSLLLCLGSQQPPSKPLRLCIPKRKAGNVVLHMLCLPASLGMALHLSGTQLPRHTAPTLHCLACFEDSSGRATSNHMSHEVRATVMVWVSLLQTKYSWDETQGEKRTSGCRCCPNTWVKIVRAAYILPSTLKQLPLQHYARWCEFWRGHSGH